MKTETKETPVKGALIYQPHGAAGEYAKWAINLYHGCSNGCTYCYNRRGVLSHVFGDKPELAAPIVKLREKLLNMYMKDRGITARENIYSSAVFIHGVLAAQRLILTDLAKIGEDKIRKDGGIFFSFTCDPFDSYLDNNNNITKWMIQTLVTSQIPVTILTKNVDWLYTEGWDRALTHHPMIEPEYAENLPHCLTIGFTITGKDELEPNAPSTEKRIEALRKLHDEYKIKTFVSLEPIIDLHSASEVIKKTYKITDEIRIGAQSPIKKNRYNVMEFISFVVAVRSLANNLDCHFMVKDSMYKQAETFDDISCRVCVKALDEIKNIYESKQKENDEK